MVCELPWLQELDLNPLIVDENAPSLPMPASSSTTHRPQGDRYSHMAIHPYRVQSDPGMATAGRLEITIRPIRPEDAEMEGFPSRACPTRASITASWTPSAN